MKQILILKAVLLLTANCLLPTFSFSQSVGINATGTPPDASAMLDVSSTDKGLLIPRVSLTSTTDVVTIASPATSLLVYNTNAAMTGGATGYWYWDGSQWAQIGAGGGGGNSWLLLGNAGTAPGTNFIGTTDAQDWIIKTNNAERMRILSGGNVGIGAAAPGAKLHVAGISGATIKIVDGNQAAGKVLTSDAAGQGSWKTPAPSGILAMIRLPVEGATFSNLAPYANVGANQINYFYPAAYGLTATNHICELQVNVTHMSGASLVSIYYQLLVNGVAVAGSQVNDDLTGIGPAPTTYSEGWGIFGATLFTVPWNWGGQNQIRLQAYENPLIGGSATFRVNWAYLIIKAI